MNRHDERPLSDQEWVTANPTRFCRIVRHGAPDQRDVVEATVLILDDDRRGWWTQNILMRAELPDTDDGARKAKAEHELLVTSRHGIGVDAMLMMLRSRPGPILQ